MLVDIRLCCTGSLVWLEESHECVGGRGRSVPYCTWTWKFLLCHTLIVDTNSSKQVSPMILRQTSALDREMVRDEIRTRARLPCKKTLPLAVLFILCS